MEGRLADPGRAAGAPGAGSTSGCSTGPLDIDHLPAVEQGAASSAPAWPGSRCALRLADEGAPVTLIATGAGSLQLGGATIDVLGYDPALVSRPLEAIGALAARAPLLAARARSRHGLGPVAGRAAAGAGHARERRREPAAGDARSAPSGRRRWRRPRSPPATCARAGRWCSRACTPCRTSSRPWWRRTWPPRPWRRCRRARPRRRSTCAATPTPRRSALARALEQPDQRARVAAALRSAIGARRRRPGRAAGGARHRPPRRGRGGRLRRARAPRCSRCRRRRRRWPASACTARSWPSCDPGARASSSARRRSPPRATASGSPRSR